MPVTGFQFPVAGLPGVNWRGGLPAERGVYRRLVWGDGCWFLVPGCRDKTCLVRTAGGVPAILKEKLQCRADQVDCSAGQHQGEGDKGNGGEGDAF